MEKREHRIRNTEHRMQNMEESKSVFRVPCSGFSLLELLIVLAIISILLSAGGGFYRNYAKNVELSSTKQSFSTDMRYMQAKAMAGEGGLRWGAHIVNGPSTNDDYYELFSTPTNYADSGKSVFATTTLSLGLSFSDPSSGSNKDIIFTKISGTTTATAVVILSEGNYATTTVTSIGAVQ